LQFEWRLSRIARRFTQSLIRSNYERLFPYRNQFPNADRLISILNHPHFKSATKERRLILIDRPLDPEVSIRIEAQIQQLEQLKNQADWLELMQANAQFAQQKKPMPSQGLSLQQIPGWSPPPIIASSDDSQGNFAGLLPLRTFDEQILPHESQTAIINGLFRSFDVLAADR
jgi:hypothetical protein